MNKAVSRLTPFIIGLLAPIYYFALMGVLGHYWTGYSWIAQHMSELGGVESPFRTVMNVFGFMGIGVLLLIFGWGFYKQFKKNALLQLSAICILIAGLFMIIVGFFPCDPQCVDVTQTGRWHTYTSIPQSITLPLAAILAGFGFGTEREWGKKWQLISSLLGWGSMVVGPVMSLPQVDPIIGLVQRVGIGFALLWVMLVSGKVLLVSKK